MEDWKKIFPALAEETGWGKVKARFKLLSCSDSLEESFISNVSIVPYTPEGYVVFQLENGDWELPGGTLEKRESYREALQRELREELGAELLSFNIFGAYFCHSLALKPYKPHLPHPNFIRPVGFGKVRIIRPPLNPPGGEPVIRVEVVGIDEACSRFKENSRPDLAQLYRLAHLIRKGKFGSG